MKSHFTSDCLSHIAQAIERVNTDIKGIDKEAWLESTLIQDAVIRNLNIIDAAYHNAQKHYQAAKEANADFPWDGARCLRDVLSYGYFQVDLDIVW